MQLLQSLPWTDPLDLAAGIDDAHWVLLYSGVQTSYSGRFSILAYNLRNSVQGNDFKCFSAYPTQERSCFDNAWFGYFGYGLKDALEMLPQDAPNWLALPPLYMMRFGTIILFDHALQRVDVWADEAKPRLPTARAPALYPVEVSGLSSNMSKKQYLGKVKTIVDRIHAGDLYQANLTRKFMGHFKNDVQAFDVFRALCAKSPAPYSAFLAMGDTYALSSSPELFLNIDAGGHVRTRPIKGTSPRFTDPGQDELSRASLAASAKDRAENLMIVDLMRNDLSRSCIAGSVATPALFEITSHANVHHMSSTVTGRKRDDCQALDIIEACFPPGSMTGAPKIKAMQLCTELEGIERGLYSGAIGYLGGDGSAELSVVIRTLLICGKRFEFQVGGGIVADSIPEQEFRETIDKSKGILNCLGISATEIESL